MEAIIKSYDLTKVYHDKNVVNKVNMTIGKGDIYGFIGSNGAGKTTFIRMLMGLIKPTSGSFELCGNTDAADIGKARAKIGCIVETPALLYNMTGRDCLRAQMLLYGFKDDKKAETLLELVGLSNTGTKKVKDFSLGMKQRLAIAQALVNDPAVLILDEPTNGMDPQGIAEIRLLLQKLRAEKGITILISSHILSELQQLATRFGIIKEGVLIDEFTAADLESRTKASIVIKTPDPQKAAGLIIKALGQGRHEVLESGNIRITDETDFVQINRLLVKNDIDVHIVAKTQPNLESYFIGRVGK